MLPGTDSDDEQPTKRDIVLYCQDNPSIPKRDKPDYYGLTRIDERHPAYDGLQYPLMNPDGTLQWAPRAFNYHKLTASQKKLQARRLEEKEAREQEMLSETLVPEQIAARRVTTRVPINIPEAEDEKWPDSEDEEERSRDLPAAPVTKRARCSRHNSKREEDAPSSDEADADDMSVDFEETALASVHEDGTESGASSMDLDYRDVGVATAETALVNSECDDGSESGASSMDLDYREEYATQHTCSVCLACSSFQNKNIKYILTVYYEQLWV